MNFLQTYLKTLFSLLSPRGLFISGPFEEGGGGLFERGAYLFIVKIICKVFYEFEGRGGGGRA